jgi:hypothetical protein
MIAHRKEKGNTILLVSLLIGLMILAALCGICFNYLLFIRAREQYVADAMALSWATKFNIADRIGEINQLQEASRELIYTSRQNCYESADSSLPGFAALCNRALDDARCGHELVERERQNQIETIRKEMQGAIVAYNQESSKAGSVSFLGLKTFKPEILRVDLGRIARVDSNVKALGSIPELEQADQHEVYFDKKTKFYRCDLNAKLPHPDSDLAFNFSSLPAYVDDTAASSRNANERVFVPYSTIFEDGKIKNASPKQIPSAIQILFGLNVAIPWNQSKTESVRLLATGSTSGASSEQSEY